jgi:hypothetical protein
MMMNFQIIVITSIQNYRYINTSQSYVSHTFINLL